MDTGLGAARPPSLCKLKWPKRRKPLEQNLRLWRDTLRQLFCGANGLFPVKLGATIRYAHKEGLLVNAPNFEDILAQYPPRYQAILGKHILGNAQADKIHSLLIKGDLYAGSDGSEKGGIGAHAYGFTSNKFLGPVWGGAAITPGNVDEMASLRVELGGAIGLLLVIYALQIQRGASTYPILIWIDNAEVLERARNPAVGDNIKNHMVLDYDLWRVMVGLIELIQTPIQWEKVNSHIEGKIFKEGTIPKGDKYSI